MEQPKQLAICCVYYKIDSAFWHCRNELFASLAASVKERGNCKELLRCTVLLSNMLTSTYVGKQQIIINNCWSEWPSLGPAHARYRERDQRTNSSENVNMNHDQMMQAPAIYSQCIPDTPQQASCLHQTLQQGQGSQHSVGGKPVWTSESVLMVSRKVALSCWQSKADFFAVQFWHRRYSHSDIWSPQRKCKRIKLNYKDYKVFPMLN
jgi:hypothetical protein